MKIILSLLVLFGSSAFAARDSVAVYQRPEKILVQINESGAGSRLQKFLSAWGAGTDLLWESPARDVRLDCGRNATAATCLIRLRPSETVRVDGRVATAEIAVAGVADAEASFESSRGQKFSMSVENGILKISADGRRGGN